MRGAVRCYTFRVGNVRLATTRAAGDTTRPGWNELRLAVGLVSRDNPGARRPYRAACLGVRRAPGVGPGQVTFHIPRGAWTTPAALYRTYRATPRSGSGSGRPCGIDGASGAPLRCAPGDRCVDPAGARCRVSRCVCANGQVGDCQAR